jgi:outer membrane protein OmpA-like peptidoglycan-associated protein
MKYFIILLFNVLGFTLNAQLKQKLADQHYERFEYSKCVMMFDELAEKCLKGKKTCNWDNVRKAAYTHYNLFEMQASLKYFEAKEKQNSLTEDDRITFIKALRYSGKYDQSISLSQKSGQQFPSNAFFKRLNDPKNNFNSLFKDSTYYTINSLSLNSGKGDFGTAFFNNSLVYASKSKNTGFLNPTYGWDDDYYLNILQANKEKDSTLGSPKLLKHNFISRAHDGPVSFNHDGTEMVITKNTVGKRKGKPVIVLSLYFSKLVNGEWTDLVPFEHNNQAYNVGHAVFAENAQKLYFVSDDPAGLGGTDVYVSNRLGDNWTKPENLGAAINTEQNEMFPFVNNGVLYFASNGHYGLGGLDIFEMRLENGKMRNLGAPINSSSDDFAYISDSNGLEGYFSTNRDGNIDNIFGFTKKEVLIDVIVQVFEKYKVNEIVPSQPITLKNEVTGEEEEYFSDKDGNLHIQVRENEKYTFSSNKEEFKLKEPVSLQVSSATKDTTYRVELILLPTRITIALRIIAKDTRLSINEATAIVTSLETKSDTTLVTNKQGLVTLNVDRNKSYNTFATKKGYLDAEKVFSTTSEDGKIIELELALTPIKKGEKFKLENIFYDLNKSTLREESIASLDKLADFILKNDLRIELSAHTDSRGSASYNQKLSQARAQSCVDYLLKKGVKSVNIRAKGYGESQLINKCKDGVTCDEELHQENRRTEVKILEIN